MDKTNGEICSSCNCSLNPATWYFVVEGGWGVYYQEIYYNSENILVLVRCINQYISEFSKLHDGLVEGKLYL